MRLIGFPGCCTAKVLTGFGGTDTAEYAYRPENDYTDETMFNEVVQRLEEAHRAGMAMVFATTNSQQEMANRVLPRAGFIKIDEAAKPNHSNYTLLGWVFRLNLADAVRPLKVPSNPFAKKKEEGKPIRGLDFGDEPPEEELVNPVPRQIPQPVLRARPVGARGGRIDVEEFIAPVPAFPNYPDLEQPLIEGQVWDKFVTHNGGRWHKVTHDATTAAVLPEAERMQYRTGTVNGVVWYEIHPNFQGNMDVFPAVSKETRLKVRLVGNPNQEDTHRAGDWEWSTRHDDGRIAPGTITHFRIE